MALRSGSIFGGALFAGALFSNGGVIVVPPVVIPRTMGFDNTILARYQKPGKDLQAEKRRKEDDSLLLLML